MAALKTYTDGDTVTHDGKDWVVAACETQVIKRGVDETVTVLDESGNVVDVDGTVIREELNLSVKLNPA